MFRFGAAELIVLFVMALLGLGFLLFVGVAIKYLTNKNKS